jgi:hypothetical protein
MILIRPTNINSRLKSLISYFAFFAMVSVLLFTVSCSQSKVTNNNSIDAFIKQAETTTPWFSIFSDELPVRGRELDALGKKFQNFSIDDAKTIIKRLSELAWEKSRSGDSPGEPQNTLSTAYVLLRYYFRVPSWDNANNVIFFGGWEGVPVKDEKVAVLWPLKEDQNGSIHLNTVSEGYFGEPYKVLDEFDYFNEKYGPRVKK